mgnify:FL=1
MSNFLIEYKNKKKQKINKKVIIENCLTEIKNIDLLNTSVSELYSSINNIQQKLNNMQ